MEVVQKEVVCNRSCAAANGWSGGADCRKVIRACVTRLPWGAFRSVCQTSTDTPFDVRHFWPAFTFRAGVEEQMRLIVRALRAKEHQGVTLA